MGVADAGPKTMKITVETSIVLKHDYQTFVKSNHYKLTSFANVTLIWAAAWKKIHVVQWNDHSDIIINSFLCVKVLTRFIIIFVQAGT